nr:L-aspartate oxidase [Geomicrobium halophilum]
MIIGSGLAGMVVAETIAHKLNVAVLSKGDITDSNSQKAQGGIAAAIAAGDHWENHLSDTLGAGDDHNCLTNTSILTKNGQDAVKMLTDWGVSFDEGLGREGAHGYPRIVHAGGDQTGKALVQTLHERTRSYVHFFTKETVLSLLKENGRCIGAKTVDGAGRMTLWYASYTVLATGGAGQLFSKTTNHSFATGDGYALAYRAGAILRDMEFIQFHPTLLMKNKKEAAGLITEATRGAGAQLVTSDNRRIMAGHPQQDLASRDVVARAIAAARTDEKEVFLDLSAVSHLADRFPGVTSLYKAFDFKKQRVPVAPGAHFMMGGVAATTEGETNVPGLYAIGEVAATGVHGANRLASNSLLEAVVFSRNLGRKILNSPRIGPSHRSDQHRTAIPSSLPTKQVIREVMDQACGVIRNEQTLKEADDFFQAYLSLAGISDDPEIQERSNMTLVAALMTKAALKRTESRGSHYRGDHPMKVKSWEGVTLAWSQQEYGKRYPVSADPTQMVVEGGLRAT